MTRSQDYGCWSLFFLIEIDDDDNGNINKHNEQMSCKFALYFATLFEFNQKIQKDSNKTEFSIVLGVLFTLIRNKKQQQQLQIRGCIKMIQMQATKKKMNQGEIKIEKMRWGDRVRGRRECEFNCNQ